MRPRWLRGWSVTARVEPTASPAGHDPRPWWQRIAAIVGLRREW